MKKKISLLLCILLASLCFTGCSGKAEEAELDKTTMEQTAEMIITNFSAMSDEDFAQFTSLSDFQLDYTMMQSGLRISAEDFVAMIDSWQAAEAECGEYVSHGDYETEEKNDGAVLSTTAKFGERAAVISFSFDKDGNMESMDVSAEYSTGEILKKAGLNTVLGMGVVFAVLIFLAFLISLIQYIPALIGIADKEEKKEEPVVQEATPVVTAPVVAAPVIAETEYVDDLELIAVITAAIAAQEGTDSSGFVVRSIRRRPSNNWR